MNFYHVYYRRQHWDECDSQWKNTSYNWQGIVVIASNLDDAKVKIEKCLSEVETGKYRAVLASDIVECIGLDMQHGFEGSYSVYPIYTKNEDS